MNQLRSNFRCQIVRIVFNLNTHRDEIWRGRLAENLRVRPCGWRSQVHVPHQLRPVPSAACTRRTRTRPRRWRTSAAAHPTHLCSNFRADFMKEKYLFPDEPPSTCAPRQSCPLTPPSHLSLSPLSHLSLVHRLRHCTTVPAPDYAFSYK